MRTAHPKPRPEPTPAPPAPPPSTPAVPTPTPAPEATERKVRRTVDLTASEHRALGRWCDDAAADLGRTRVTGQDVLQALVRRLLADDTLADSVRADLRTH